ncbi:hypothetical protein Tco_0046724 [Tanacetum coccineum]
MSRPAGGNLLTKTPRDALTIIENKSKVRNSRNKPIVSKVSTNAPSSSTPHSPKIAALVDAVKAMLHQKSSPLASVKAVEEICVTCGGPHPYYNVLAMDGKTFFRNIKIIFKGYVFSCHQLNYNQEIPGSVLKDVANQIRTPGFVRRRRRCHNHDLVFVAFDKRHIGEDAIISPMDRGNTSTEKFINEIGELRAISSHVLAVSRFQIPHNNLDNLQSIREEEDGATEISDPRDVPSSIL